MGFLFLGLHGVESLCVFCSFRFLFARCACPVTFKCVPFFWRTHDLFRMKFGGLLKRTLTLNNNSNFASKPTKNECLSVLSFFSVFLFLGLHAVESLCVFCSIRFLFARCARPVTFKYVPFFWRTHDLCQMKFDGLQKHP